MTSRHLEYVLDRLLTRQTSIPGPVVDTTYRFNSKELSVTEVIAAGRWAIDGVELYLYQEDADGLLLPVGDSLTPDDESLVTITSGEYTFTTMLLSFETARNINHTPLTNRRHLTLAMAPTIPQPEFTISLPIAGQPTIITSTKQVWCTRLDFRGRDQINITAFGATFTLGDTRIIVRNDGTWKPFDVFSLDGAGYNVRGVSEIGGRKQYLELVARSGF